VSSKLLARQRAYSTKKSQCISERGVVNADKPSDTTERHQIGWSSLGTNLKFSMQSYT